MDNYLLVQISKYQHDNYLVLSFTLPTSNVVSVLVDTEKLLTYIQRIQILINNHNLFLLLNFLTAHMLFHPVLPHCACTSM